MSGLKAQLRDDLTQSMRDRDEIAKSTIRMVLAAIGKAEVAGNTAVELTDEDVLKLLASEQKKRIEAADLYDQGGRDELATKERAEAKFIARYLPAALDDATLNAIIAEEIANAATSGTTGGKAMGVVIKAVKDRAGQPADGARVAAAVKAALA